MAAGALGKFMKDRAMAKTKPTAAAPPAQTQKPKPPPKGTNQLGNMSVWDKIVYGQTQSGQDSWAAQQAKAEEQRKREEKRQAEIAAATKQEKQDRGTSTTSLGGDISTADDALAAYERQNNLAPGTYSTGGQTTDQTSANRSLETFEKSNALKPGTLSTPDTAPKPESEGQTRDRWGQNLGGAATETRALTWDEYDALSPNQRAAVDANTLLVNAIKQDLSTGARAADSDDAAYQESLNALFGKTGGSDTYAPATVSVLSQLGLADTKNGDLDNYLTQSALVNEDDLASIATGSFSDNARGQQTQLFSQQALTSISDTLSSGYGILSGVSAANAESGELNDLFEMLSQRGNFDQLQDGDVSEIMGMFLQENPSIDQGTLTRYFEDRLNAYDYGIAAGQTPSLGSADAASYVTPAEFRGRYFATGGN